MSTFKKAILQLHVFVFLAGLTGPLGYLIQLNGILIDSYCYVTHPEVVELVQ